MKSCIHSCVNCPSWKKSIFSELSTQEAEELAPIKKSMILKKNESAFSQGDAVKGLYCIGTGGLKIIQKINSMDTLIRLAPPGDTAGHRSLFLDTQYKGSAIAMADTEICFISQDVISKLLNTNTYFALKLIKKMAADINLTEELNISQRQKNVRERFAELLLFLDLNFGRQESDTRNIIEMKLTRQEIASLIGTAQDTIIRLFSEFKENNWIKEVEKNIVILDRSMIKKLSGTER